MLKFDECIIVEVKEECLEYLVVILDNMFDWVVENNWIVENFIMYRDLFDIKIMGCFVSMFLEVNWIFYEYY